MASISSNTSNGYRLTLNISEKSTSIPNNTSSVSWSLTCSCGSSYAQWNPGPGNVSVRIDGRNVYNGTPSFVFPGLHSSITLCSGSLTIGHNADGSKRIGCSASFTATASAYYLPGNMSLNGEVGLSTIARATQPNLSNQSCNIGSSVTINTPRASGNFTHKLTYDFGGHTGDIASDVATSYSWTVPQTFAQWMPSSQEKTCVITCETYNGGHKIGSKNVNLTVTITDTYAPVISSLYISESTSGISYKFNNYVQSRSALTINVNAVGQQGAQIKSCTVKFEGYTYTGTRVTTGIIQGSGNVPIEVSVTDSRGKIAKKIQNVTVLPYDPPKINNATVVRSNQYGQADENGTYALFNFDYVISELGYKNDKSFKIQYYNSGSWHELTSFSDYKRNGNYLSSITFSKDQAFKFKFIVSDYFETYTIEKSMDISYSLLNFGANGHSIGIGKHSSNDSSFECTLPAKFENDVELKGSKFSISLAIQKVIGKLMNPVGTVVINTTGANPSTYLGGTWEQFAQGRTLVGAGTGNDGSTSMSFSTDSTGGTYKHKLTISEMPSHKYTSPLCWDSKKGTSSRIDGRLQYLLYNPQNEYGIDTRSLGNDVPHNNIQPYKVVYYFRRTK